MDLFPPDTVAVDRASRELIAELDDLLRAVNRSRPLAADVLDRLNHDLLGERVYSSNAIEGSSLTLRETQLILETGQILGVGRQRESLEALQLGKAIEFVREAIARGDPFADQATFLEVHRILLSGWADDLAGRMRNESERVRIGGAKHQPPRDVAAPLRSMFEFLTRDTATHPLILAAWTHWAIARIHPFLDGNGRMARLWQDFILLSRHYTPAIIPEAVRKEYYAALQRADDGQFAALLQLVAQSAVATARRLDIPVSVLSVYRD